MHAPIRHRGPDGERFLVWDGSEALASDTAGELRGKPGVVGLAFRRLKIIDLSERAAQPMRSARSGVWVVFNGEIYNFRKLRDELRRAGHEFNSESDTEVVLAAYNEWGSECFRRLHGMWAIALLDPARRRVVLSRDRLAIKPLYWAVDGDAFLFASEIRQILAATGRAAANVALLSRYLRGNRLPCYDETFFEGIRSVPAASLAELSLDGPSEWSPRFQQYWTLRDTVARPVNANSVAQYQSVREEFEDLLRDVVRTHQQSDVRLGSLLSGGLDSGVLAALLSESTSDSLPTFSFGFRERAPRWCELPYVDAIVRTRPNLEHHETTLDPEWLAANARRVMRTLEEPPLALPALAQYRVFELCKEHGVTVVLDGEGSDEVLAGYAPYQRALLIDFARDVRLGRLLGELHAIARRQGRSSPGVLFDFFGAPLLRRFRRHSYAWLNGSRVAGESIDYSRDRSLVNRMLYDATRWGNVKIVLSYTDKNAMAHSVEARVPYMDHRIVEYAFSLPAEFKVGNGDRKRILRDIGRTLLPPAVTERKDRMGFATPDNILISGRFADLVREAIRDPSFVSLPLFEQQALAQFVDDYDRGRHDDVRAIWRLFAVAAWRDEFSVTM